MGLITFLVRILFYYILFTFILRAFSSIMRSIARRADNSVNINSSGRKEGRYSQSEQADIVDAEFKEIEQER